MSLTIRSSLFLLTYCQFIYSVHRHHHRRSISYDSRWLGFKWVSEPQSGTVDIINLPCLFEVAPKNAIETRIEWKRDGAIVTALKNLEIHPNGSLTAENAVPSNEGAYQCAVHVTAADTSTWTFTSRTANIRLPSLPRFESQPEDRRAAPGQSVTFPCFVDTRPAPSVKWYHNGRLITNGGDFIILPDRNSLEIARVLPKHSGSYKCVVESAGKSRTSQAAQLKVDATVDNSELELLAVPRSHWVLEGEPTLLECLPNSGTAIKVEWLKDNSVLVEDGDRVRRVGVGSLYFKKVLISDAATYTCRVTKDGDVVDASAGLQVKVPPMVVAGPTDRTAAEATDVELECSATGRPAPSVSWFKNGESLVPSEYFVIEATRLRILGLVKTDQGVYQCVAENDVGSAQASAQLLVDSADSSSVAGSSGKPLLTSSPLGLRTTLIGARVIGVEWDAPLQRHGTVLNYHIFYKEEGSDRERTVNSSSTSATIAGLQPETLYIVRVAAENEAGVGRSSDHIKVTTKKEQAVPGRVTSLSAVPIGAETIEVRWDPPPSDGPQAKRYRLFYIRYPPEPSEKETQITVSSTAYTLHGMEKYSQYAIRVEAEGENGAGLTSDTLTVRTLSDLPAMPPRQIVAEPQSSTSIRVTWEPPEQNSLHGELGGYRLRYKTKQRGGKVNTLVIDDPNQREYVIDGLESNVQYLLRMAVVNQNGSGPYSDWMRADTPAVDKEDKLLGAPVELKPAAGPDYILVAWKPPSDETTIVRSYQIGWGINVPDLETATVPASTMQYKISGLQPGKEYVISLRAKNKVGLGYPIYETLRTSSSARAPLGFDSVSDSDESIDTPVAVRAETVSGSSIRVTWTDPDEDAFNTKYTIRYSTAAEGNKLHLVNSTDTYKMVESLRPATEYEFAVRAFRGYTESTWSMAARNRTFSIPPSSPPRDVTLSTPHSGDPHQVVLNWQPPKYANGEVVEYLIFYTDRNTLPDKDWRIAYVPADRLSHNVHDLLPKTSYYFKIQARNEMGYGPLSQTVHWDGAKGASASQAKPTTVDGQSQMSELVQLVLGNPLYLAVIAAFGLLLLLAIILVSVCVLKRGAKSNKRGPGYGAGKRGPGQAGDLWINHPGGGHVRGAGMSDMMCDGSGVSATDMRHLGGPEHVDSPPPRYHPGHPGLQQEPAYGTINAARPRRTPLRQSVSSYEDRGSDSRRPLIGRAKPMQNTQNAQQQHVPYAMSEDSGGTLSRSYHHSSSSLEGRQRTPQVVYTGTGRHQPIAKIELCDSEFGSSSQLAPPTPPLQNPHGIQPIVDGYRTLRGQNPTTSSANPLRSFTSLSGVQPPQQATVRPVIIAAGGKQLPVGRATAQPRVNVANIYSPYASCSQISTEEEKKLAQQQAQAHELSDQEEHEPNEGTPLQPSVSTEDLLNAQMNLDIIIDDLQALNHELAR